MGWIEGTLLEGAVIKDERGKEVKEKEGKQLN